MEFWLKVKAFLRFYLVIAIENKANLIFKLLFPIILQLIAVRRTSNMTHTRFIDAIIPMFAYIIVSTAINGVTSSIISTRNSGYIKQYYFASGSRWAIYWANLLIQLLLVFFENMIFVLAMMIIYNSFSLKILVIFLLTTIITFPIVALGFNFLFIMPIRTSSMAIISTAVMLGLLLLLNLTPVESYTGSIAILNPYMLIGVIITCLMKFSWSLFMQIIAVMLFYGIIGIFGYQNFNLQNRGLKS